MSEPIKRERIEAFDVIRGVMILLMVFYHFLYDLVFMADLPSWILYNPLLNICQPIGAGIFIVMSGAMSRYSRSNLKRGLKLGGIAIIVSIVTSMFDSTILFGILHFLAVSSIIYALIGRFLDKIPFKVQPILYAVLWAISLYLISTSQIRSDFLWFFGFKGETLWSADYFPMLPWFFVFLFGTWFGEISYKKKLPQWFYGIKNKFFAKCGRYSLFIYVLHQPIMYGLFMIPALLKGI